MADQPHNPQARAHQIHAPWRDRYMELIANHEPSDRPPEGGKSACFLEEYWRTPSRDAENHVILRTGTPETGAGGMVMLNRYPYANGHLLVAMGTGRQRLLDYSENERREFWSLVDLATDLCERTLSPQGVNVGVNQGKAAGAGVPEHLHAHVVPRWSGDVNFITAVGNIRVIPSALDDMFARYKAVWDAIKPA